MLEVIGAGLGRTGTMSLKIALEMLGFGPCYHMSELMAANAAGLWVEAARGRPDWERIFAGFQSTTDYPACEFWRELIAAYPAAKVILTLRDPDRWFDSCSATIFSEQMERLQAGALPEIQQFFAVTTAGRLCGRQRDRGAMTAYFRDHNAAVMAGVPDDRLLVYEVAQGWEPLCGFLGTHPPSEPFPHVNERAELEGRLAAEPTLRDDRAADARRYLEEQRRRARLKSESAS